MTNSGARRSWYFDEFVAHMDREFNDTHAERDNVQAQAGLSAALL